MARRAPLREALIAAAVAVLAVAAGAEHGFGPPAALNSHAGSDTAYDMSPVIATDGGGNWVTLWYSSENVGGTIGSDYDILVSRSSDNGATWTPAAALGSNATTDSESDYQPSVATDGSGRWVAVWTSYDTLGDTIGGDADILVSSSTDNGLTWSAVAALNSTAASDTATDAFPAVASDGAGTWIAVWQSGPFESDIFVSRSTDGGVTWSAAAVLNSNAPNFGWNEHPAIAADGAGVWVVVWNSEDYGGTTGSDREILVSRSTDGGATWSAVAAVNSNAGSDSGEDFDPAIAADGAGHLVAVWYSGDSLGGTIGTDADILVSRSGDHGASWSAVAALNTNAGSDSGDDTYPAIAADGTGNWVAVWYSNDTLGGTIGPDYDVLAARSTDLGATWSPVAALDPNAAADSGGDEYPAVATDGAGQWVAVWDALGVFGIDPDILVSASSTLPVELLSFDVR